jgi:hypothetical protein
MRLVARTLGALWLLGSVGCAKVFGIEEGELAPSFDVAGSIAHDTTWMHDQTPVLRGLVVVESGATLTIEAGTRVLADPDGALLVDRGGKLLAHGTKDAPIVFTSAASVRHRGDWHGVAFCGRATINGGDGGTRPMDILDSPRTFVCGGSEDNDSSGELHYVRIEFAGRGEHVSSAPGGLELDGVGSGTLIDHLQIHDADDDSIVLYGGAVSMKHLMLTNSHDDGLDWAYGWQGKVQFLSVVMGPLPGESGLEGGQNGNDSLSSDPGTPSAPLVYNATIVGDPSQTGSGLSLGDGTQGKFFNMLVTNAANAGLDIHGSETFKAVANQELDIRNSIFASAQNFEDGADFKESEWALAAAKGNRSIAPNNSGLRSTDPTRPDLSLQSGAAALTGAATPPDDGFFDPTATFVGACGETCPELSGWTAFPAE